MKTIDKNYGIFIRDTDYTCRLQKQFSIHMNTVLLNNIVYLVERQVWFNHYLRLAVLLMLHVHGSFLQTWFSNIFGKYSSPKKAMQN